MAAGHRTYRERALDLTRDRGIARARDFKAAGIPLVYLKRLTASGDLIKLSRGLYQDPEHAGADVAHNLAEAARLVPKGVVSLLSALRHHELTTQLPHGVWMTIPHKARTPAIAGLRLEIVRAMGRGLWKGFQRCISPTLEPPAFSEVQAELRRFFGPILASLATPEGARGTWDPGAGMWR